MISWKNWFSTYLWILSIKVKNNGKMFITFCLKLSWVGNKYVIESCKE